MLVRMPRVVGGAGLRKGMAGLPAARHAKHMVNRCSVLGSQLGEESENCSPGEFLRNAWM